MSTKHHYRVCLLFLAGLSITLSLSAQECAHQDLLDKIDQAMIKKDPALLAEAYHEDAVRYTPDGAEEGLTKIQDNAKAFYENIPDAKGTNLDVTCTENRIIVRWKGTGTPKGSPKSIEVTGITIYEVVDGKVAVEWEEMSTLSLMMQMGFELKPPGGN